MNLGQKSSPIFRKKQAFFEERAIAGGLHWSKPKGRPSQVFSHDSTTIQQRLERRMGVVDRARST